MNTSQLSSVSFFSSHTLFATNHSYQSYGHQSVRWSTIVGHLRASWSSSWVDVRLWGLRGPSYAGKSTFEMFKRWSSTIVNVVVGSSYYPRTTAVWCCRQFYDYVNYLHMSTGNYTYTIIQHQWSSCVLVRHRSYVELPLGSYLWGYISPSHHVIIMSLNTHVQCASWRWFHHRGRCWRDSIAVLLRRSQEQHRRRRQFWDQDQLELNILR